MAETTLVLVHVNSADLYKTGHMAARWFGKVSRRLGTFTRAAAPRRTGAMKSGIKTKMRSVPQARQMTIDWRSEVPYTVYVLRGTTGPIMTNLGWATTGGADFPNGGEGTAWDWAPSRHVGMVFAKSNPGFWMPVGRKGSPYPFTWKTHVEGQTANNFLLKGWRKTAYFHHSMRNIPTFVRHP